MCRYDSYYVYKLLNNRKDCPGLETFLKVDRLSVQAQSDHSVGRATDQHGEQTVNKDARTGG